MIRYRHLFAASLVALVATSAFADTTWDAVKKKVAGASAYDVNYTYNGQAATDKITGSIKFVEDPQRGEPAA